MDTETRGAQIQFGEPVQIKMHGELVWTCVAKVKDTKKRLPFLGSDSDHPAAVGERENKEECKEENKTVFMTNGVGPDPASAIADARARLARYARGRGIPL